MSRELTWTTERPMNPGWYWVRFLRQPWVLYVSEYDIICHEREIFTKAREWAGPIPEPYEPTKSECGYYDCNSEDCYGK